MDDSIKIRIKAIRPKTEKGRLPGRLPRGYPKALLVPFIFSTVLKSLEEFASSNLDLELGGVLIGRFGKATRRMFVEVHNFIPAEKGISRRASFEFTNDAQEQIHTVLETRYPDMKIVGWFHTHPGYGIFLSHMDQFIDQHYFNEKYHIAVVLDPTKPSVESGAFVWNKEGKRVLVSLVPL